ncbi:MAG TPA: AhpA/YtjB family protein [Arsenophonus sp.]
MTKTKLKFRLHKTVIILICISLLVILVQGISYFSRSQQQIRVERFKELAQTLVEQVAFSSSNYIQSDGKNFNNEQILAILKQLTINAHILDANVYLNDSTQIQHAGEKVALRERLSLNQLLSHNYVNYQLIVPILDTKKPKGFLRLTIDAHQFSIGSKQTDNMANLLRIMLLLTLIIGFILANVLTKSIAINWPKIPFIPN